MMKKLFSIVLIFLIGSVLAQSPIVYNWQNSKQGWISGGGCNLTALPGSMSMNAFNTTPLMRSGNLQANLGLNASDYNQVTISVKNPTTGNGNTRLYIYPPGTNTASCYFVFAVDTAMTGFTSYTIDLNSTPASGTYSGTIARFGIRGPWGVGSGDTIYWENMVVSNTSSQIMGNLYEDQFNDYTVSNWGNLTISNVPKFNFFETACQELKVYSDSSSSAPAYGYVTYEFDSIITIFPFEKVTLGERSSSSFPIRIDFEDSTGNVTNGNNGKITVSTNSNINSVSQLSFVFPDQAFNESNVDKTIISKLRVFLDFGNVNMSSPIFIDYLSIGDSSGLNNAIGLSEIDSCNCDILVFDTISVCDTLTLSNGNIVTTSGNYFDTLSLFPACDSIRNLSLTILNSSSSLNSIFECGSYIWNGMTYTQSGNYSFTTVNNLGCDSLAILDLIIYDYPSPQIISSSPQLTVNVSGGNSPYTYLWNTGETTSSITPINNGNFYVDVLDANNCLGSDSIIVNFVGIENDFTYEFQIFPNPSNENITLSSNFYINNPTKINIYNLTGKLVLSENVAIKNGSSENINVSSLRPGVYLLEIKNPNLINQMFPFIKK
jgi:hypothetical protein